ncbi:hypothetical protein ACNI3K_03255 [Demequina sp. SO4-13]|uniref:hypothetical protein n=1 Tax=Demequina sp. SO4-13 TaxID=3401027 RepID=UPI003AF482CD
MATRNPDEGRNPWAPVNDGGVPREAVAPSKPHVPSSPRSAPRPEPIEVEDHGDADVVAPVSPPSQEEILPTVAGRTAPSAGGAVTEGDGASRDPYSALSDAAVRNASLSASGAPTPLGGVRRVEPAEVSDHEPSRWFTPQGATTGTGWVAGDPRADAPPSAHEWARARAAPPESAESSAPANGDAPSTPSGDDESTNAPDDETSMYTPRVAAGADPGAAAEPDGGDGEDGGADDSPASARAPWWRSVPVLVIAGLVVMGGIGYAVYSALAAEEPVELTAPVIVVSPAPAALDPIAIEDPTEFQAAMPGIVGAYALTEFDAPAPASLDLPARAAEVGVFTYSDGETSVTLRAIQHFDVEAAVAQFEALAADGADRAPLEAGGVSVGERVTVPADDGGQAIVWRNQTAVFEVTGPTEAVATFFALFPL